ncbi:hypothetical protein [Pedobacter sp. GR22-6]|uniref:hypothetical protein n=1 Tax=Pedobacter sp. GR22-6 TaxID=3127957 RepID=UPI00307E2515
MNLSELKKAAKDSIEILFGKNIRDFRVEQIEKASDNLDWEISVSFLMDNINIPHVKNIIGMPGLSSMLPYDRVYKTLLISEEGTFKNMKMFKDGSR